MQKWNRTLLGLCGRYPNTAGPLRLGRLGANAMALDSDGHFEYDGIHYNTVGNIAKARLTARALAHAYPAGEPPSKTCVVR